MIAAVDGFIPERLVDAREARRLTAVALSELIGVGKALIHQYEKGLTRPSHDVLARFSRVLNQPESYFIWARTKTRERHLFWRSLAATTKLARKSAGVKFEWVVEFAEFQRAFLKHPKVNLPDWSIEDPIHLENGAIERYADQLRSFWGLSDGPIGNLTWLLEGNGILVALGNMDAVGLDAASEWPTDCAHPVILLATDIHSCARRRFNLAHELAHLVLHRQADRKLMSEMTAYYKRIEEQAHRFAAAFLFPERSFKREAFFPSLDRYRTLKSRWNLSIGMMLMRAEQLGLIDDEDQRKRMWINYNRRGWKASEPLDDETPLERPNLLADGFRAIMSNGVMTKNEILAAVPIGSFDIESICGLEPGELSDSPPLVELKSTADVIDISAKKRGDQAFKT